MVTRQKILVTGANGQLGREIKQVSPSYAQYQFIFLSREDLSLENPELVKGSFEKYRPQYCINCAAYTAVDKAESEIDLAFKINGDAVGSLAMVCKEYDTQLIHISTDYVFDGAASVPYQADSPVNPQSMYGASKLVGERQAIRFNPSSLVIRTSWVYSEFRKNFVKTMMKLMSEKKEINVVNDQLGSPTYAADLAEAILQMLPNLSSHVSGLTSHANIYHFSNKGIISWYEFALAIKELTGSVCKVNPIPTSQYPTPAKRPAYSVLDTSKIERDFDIVLKDWKESLHSCLKRLSTINPST